MKVLFDTNIWIRYVIKDNQKQFEEAKSLVEANEAGFIKLYSSSIIFLEISYVLKNLYHFQFKELWEVMEGIRQTRDITMLQNTDLEKALSLYKTYRIKFSDCLIASQLPKDMILTTFDLEFKKIKEITSQTPKEFFLTFKNMN